MKIGTDYVIAHNARRLGKGSLATSLQGIFIGTPHYFFFVPVNTTEDIRKTKKGKPVAPTFFYKGKPIRTVMEDLIEKNSVTIREIEDFILKKVQKEIEETICVSIAEIGQFKIYSKWWGSGILINLTDGKSGWEPLVSRFKENKRNIKQFYKGHAKFTS